MWAVLPLSTSRSVSGGMPTTAKASPRSSAARASASVSARTATLTAPLASRVCTMPRLNSLRSLSTTAIGILRKIWLRYGCG
jgi:hypothetical protein